MTMENFVEKMETEKNEATQSSHKIEGEGNDESQEERKGELTMQREKACQM